MTIFRDAVIEDSGRPDPVKLDAEEIAVERLPNDILIAVCSAAAIAKPISFLILPGNCSVDTSWLAPGSNDLRLRLQPSGFRLSSCACHPHRI